MFIQVTKFDSIVLQLNFNIVESYETLPLPEKGTLLNYENGSLKVKEPTEYFNNAVGLITPEQLGYDQ